MNNNYIPNTSAIPNILFDYWMDKLSPSEFKVLMCIARKTYGWHKEFDMISLKQIEKMTGLSRYGILKNIEVLIQKGLLIKIKSKTTDGDDAPNRYTINVNCDVNRIDTGSELSTPPQEKSNNKENSEVNFLPDVNCIGGGRQLNCLGVGNSVDQGVGNSVDPQKKDYTKENLQETTSKTEAAKPQTAEAVGENFDSSSKSKKKVTKDFSPEVLEVANRLIEITLSLKPKYRPPKNMAPFLVHVDFMLRIDKRTPQELYDVLSWTLPNFFYGSGMLSGNLAEKLREKFVTLEDKMNAQPPPKERKFAPSSDDARAFEIMRKCSEDAL